MHLYLVHKSILANQSLAFVDMLDLHDGEEAATSSYSSSVDSWNGVPIVKMVADSDESVLHVLTAIYERE